MAEVRGEVSKTGQAPPTVVIGARFGAVERVLIAGPRFVGVSRVAGDMNSNPTSVNSAWPGTAGGHEARRDVRNWTARHLDFGHRWDVS